VSLRMVVIAILCAILTSCDQPQESHRFWWNWWVTGAAAMTTVLAVFAAIAGPLLADFARAKWCPPTLTVQRTSAEGEIGRNRYQLQTGSEKEEQRRFFHLTVANQNRRISPAEDVQVSLLTLQEQGDGGNWDTAWVGDIPLTWRNQQISPLQRTFGHPYDCDLCSVGKDLGFSLALLVQPLNMVSYTNRKKKVNIILTVQARGRRNDSPHCHFQIVWDGNWDDAGSGMKNHLVITELTKYV
jgi:hypothetical protein